MGKSSPPPAPDYTPFIQSSQAVSASDIKAAELQYDLGLRQLASQDKYAQAASDRADKYYDISRESQDWARQQFNEVWPYAKDYLQQQKALGDLAGQNASEAVAQARENRRQATETYNRYMTEFAPLESKFAQTAQDYNTPARAAQASAAAQADVNTAFRQQQDARETELRSYGIDPSQARYQGEAAIADTQRAAALASAGTQARRAQELTGIGLTQQAIAVGQKLPTVSLGQIEAATGGASGGLQSGALGGAGLTGATGVYSAGASAGGSPVGYGYLANAPTTLAGQYGNSAASMFSGGNAAYGNAGNVLGVGASALHSGFQDQMSIYNAQVQQQQALFGGIGRLVGGVGSAALMSPWVGTALGFSDRRLKEDDRVVGYVGALPLHQFRYRGDSALQIGYMADEVEQLDPGAVLTSDSGFKMVHYPRATAAAISALEG